MHQDLSSPFTLKSGVKLKKPFLNYSWEGDRKLPVIVILGGISSNSNVLGPRGWWNDFVGPKAPINTNNYSILSFDFLGGNGKSYGPRTSKNKEYSIDTHDQAKALNELITHLKISKIEAIVGSSYGGMVGLAFASRYPKKAKKLIVISASNYSNTRSIALRSLQRQIVLSSRSKKRGLIQARSLAMIGYRSVQEFEIRFGRKKSKLENEGLNFLVEDYLKAKGIEFSKIFNYQAFLNLSESIDFHHVDPNKIKTSCILIAVDSDQLVFSNDIKILSKKIKAPSKFYEIKSLYGHDAFLKEVNSIGKILKSEL